MALSVRRRSQVGRTEEEILTTFLALSLLDPGLHDFRIRAVDKNGGYKDNAETIETVRLHKSFFTDPKAVDLSSSTVSLDGARVLIENLMVDGEPYDVRLRWRKESQDFDIIDID